MATAAPDTHTEIAPRADAAGDAFVVAAERALASGNLDLVPDAELERVMTAAVRLYAAKADTNANPPAPVTGERVTPTDIVVTVTEMLRAAGLNLWDLSMWFQRGRGT
jgi:hypothetical protein